MSAWKKFAAGLIQMLENKMFDEVLVHPDLEGSPIARATAGEVREQAEKLRAQGKFPEAVSLLLEKAGYEMVKKKEFLPLISTARQIAQESREARTIFLFHTRAADVLFRGGKKEMAATEAKRGLELAARLPSPKMIREIFPMYIAAVQDPGMMAVDAAISACVRAGDALTAAFVAIMAAEKRNDVGYYRRAFELARRAGAPAAKIGRAAAEKLLEVKDTRFTRRELEDYLRLAALPAAKIPGLSEKPAPPGPESWLPPEE